MIDFSLPKTVEVNGNMLEIRYDFRVILEIMVMLNDADLTDADKCEALLDMFYIHPEEIDSNSLKDAVYACFRFIECNSPERKKKKQPQLVDWEQDFNYIIGPVNKVLGYESRSVSYDAAENTGGIHWWTFMAAYMEIDNECLFSQILTIRDKQARGKKLEKHEREWLNRNSDLVKIRTHYSDNEEQLISEWTKGG